MSKELEQIIFKFLLREELTFREKQQLNTWLDADKANRKTLSHMKLILTTRYEHKSSEIKSETWDWLMHQQKTDTLNPVRSSLLDRGLGQFFKVAVVLLFIATAGILSTQLSKNTEPVVHTERLIEKVALPGQKITTLLPDGTKVKLNAGSQLVVPEKFGGDIRQVMLVGEAFFEVTHDPSRPFIIKTQEMNVSVLGTSFNVRSYPSDDLIEVAVATGKVAFSRGSRELNTHLERGEKGSYSKSKNSLSKQEFNPSVEYGWKDNLLVFDQDHFAEIIEALSKWYGVSFELDKAFNSTDKTFSGSYDDPTLSAVIQGLSYVYRFQYEIKKDQVIIKDGRP